MMQLNENPGLYGRDAEKAMEEGEGAGRGSRLLGQTLGEGVSQDEAGDH